MSKRAEQMARKVYPYEGGVKGLICENSRQIFIQGYERAEKDLALTPEDIIVILNLAKEHSPEETAELFNKTRE